MNTIPQLFYVEPYPDGFVIYSAFKTKEHFVCRPWSMYQAFKKLKSRRAAVALFGPMANPAIAAKANLAKNS